MNPPTPNSPTPNSPTPLSTARRPRALRFQPVLKRTIWGGRRLGEQLGKPLGPEADYAESWELVDHGKDQSIVCGGALDGMSLSELVRQDPEWLLGSADPSMFGPRAEGGRGEKGGEQRRFPLLLKYLDCHRVLSVQVHPDDEYARKMSPPDLGKTEAWYIVASEPESVIYAGLKPGVDRATLAEAVQAGQTEEALHSFHPEPGDCVFIPAGTVHALGGGLLVCEIQQSSDTTFRLFDWNRVDDQGNARPLHVEASLDVTDYQRGPVSPQPIDRTKTDWQELVACDKFVLRALVHRELPLGDDPCVGGDGRFHLLTVPDGYAQLTWPDETVTLRRGETILVPAGSEAATVSVASGGVLLAMHLPETHWPK